MNHCSPTTYVMLHWFWWNKHSFDMLKIAILEHNAYAHFFCLNLKGHGSDIIYYKEKELFSSVERSLESYIEHLDWELSKLILYSNLTNIIIIGHSFWALLICKLLQKRKFKQISQLIFLNPAFYRPHNLPLFGRLNALRDFITNKPTLKKRIDTFLSNIDHYSWFRKKLFDTSLKSFVLQRYHRYIYQRNVYTKYIQSFYIEQSKNPHFLIAFWMTALWLFKRSDIQWSEILQKIGLPTLIIHWEQDKRFLWKDLQKGSMTNKNIQFITLEQISHNPHEEDPYRVAKIIVNRVLQ